MSDAPADQMNPVPGSCPANTSNRHGFDYREAAKQLGPPPCPIIDIHTHLSGERASLLYEETADLFGIQEVWTMTQLENAPAVQAVLGDRVRFTAVPNWRDPDPEAAHGADFLERIERFHDELGSRMLKLFAAPRLRDVELEIGHPGLFQLDSPVRRKNVELAERLGMMVMTHIADPDTWFEAKYNDPERYGTKRDQYKPLERMLEAYDVQWIAAHMGGSPEDLPFLDELLERHDNLHLDTSACKWMVRTLGSQTTHDTQAFFTKWRGRIFFGSDILTMDEHLEESTEGNEYGKKASGAEQAFDLYASRYWSLRSMLERTGTFESPIVDPDLHMVDPERHTPNDAPVVTCHNLERDVLTSLYRDGATAFMNRS